jgi:hypothetical protein
MDELLRERILRRLDSLPNDKAYQVLDYIDFLESKFGNRSGQPSTLEKIADRVEDTLRAGRVSVSAIKGTRDVFDAAGKVMQGIADAGKTVVDELQAPIQSITKKGSSDKKASDTQEKEGTEGKEEDNAESSADDDGKETA